MMSKTKAWILASRPKTLPASIGPVFLGACLAGKASVKESPTTLLLTFLCALLMQVGTNLVNDYYDSVRGLDDQNRLGPQRALQMGWLEARSLKKGFILVFTLALGLGVSLMIKGGAPIVIIGLSSIAMAYMYTGGPFPLSYFALGEILALIFFGPVPVWGTYFLLTHEYNLFPAIIGLMPGLVSMSLMGINNLRDNVNDKIKGKKTLTTIFGVTFGRSLILAGIFGSILIPIWLYFYYNEIFFLSSLLIFFIHTPNWLKVLKGSIDEGLNHVLAQTGKYLFVLCLIVGLGFTI